MTAILPQTTISPEKHAIKPIKTVQIINETKILSTEYSDALTFLQKIVAFQSIGYTQKHPIRRDNRGNYHATMQFVGGIDNDPLGIEEFLGKDR